MKDDVKAAYNLGLIYSGGSLGEPNLGKTEEWFKTAASEGFTYTQTGLGGILYGRGNIAGAKRWFHLAADQGEPTAMYNLDTFNASGMVEMSERRAMELLARAASAGIEEARVLISKLTSGGL